MTAASTPANGSTTPMRFAVRSARVMLSGCPAKETPTCQLQGARPCGFIRFRQMTQVGDVLRPELPVIAEEILAAIRREVADYDRPLKGEFGRNVRLGVEFALGRFLDELDEGGEAPGVSETSRLVYVELGRGEFREG